MRFVRDAATFEIWIQEDQRGVQLLERTSSGPVVRRRTQPRSWVAAGLYDELLARFAEGWRRVHDPGREPDIDDEPREPQLEAALAVGDDVAAAVYADWYQHHDHPRGDLISLQLAIAARPDDEALRAREAQLRLEWRDHFAGSLHDHPHVELVWRRGFVDTVRIVGEPDMLEAVELMWDVVRQPSLRFLHTLEVATSWFRDARGAIEVLLCAPTPPPLRRLRILDHRCDPPAARIAATFPRLEELALTGPSAFADPVRELTNVRRFAYLPQLLRRDHAAAIGAARWPQLEELELRWSGVAPEYVHDPGDEQSTADDLEAMLLAIDAPRLRALRFRRIPFADELVARLVRWPGAASLEVLEFDTCALGDIGAVLLASSRVAFPCVESLIVRGGRITQRGYDRLAEAGLRVTHG